MVIRNERMSVGPCRGRSIAAIAPLAPIASPAETTDLASPAHSPIADRDHVGRCWWKKAILSGRVGEKRDSLLQQGTREQTGHSGKGQKEGRTKGERGGKRGENKKLEKYKRGKKKKMMNLGYRESNPGLMSKLSLLRSESHRCYRYTIPD